MSLHYLLDGYNLINKMPAVDCGSLEDKRNNLIRFIEKNQPQGSLSNKVTIVFDGQVDVIGGSPHRFINIIFSRGESADSKIKEIVEASCQRKNMVVVTDDRDIQYFVRSLGAKVCPVKDFVAAKQKARKPPAGKNISKLTELKINQELAKVWLKK